MKKCSCGGTIERGKTFLEGFLLEANICDKCGDFGLPIESAKELLRLREEAEKINSIRKVVKIGNSIGITLPPEAEEMGFKEGTSVDVHLIGEHEIVIRPKPVKA
ncbi:MAG TPA: AbrB/MazE/SpoVT family DNA-binding domain-containing protein [archaeon]|nr:AbrB/MazE/SpoVT family DNA-binding domain-containing protein [archaeon]